MTGQLKAIDPAQAHQTHYFYAWVEKPITWENIEALIEQRIQERLAQMKQIQSVGPAPEPEPIVRTIPRDLGLRVSPGSI